MSVPPDKLVVFRTALGRSQRENGAAIGRRDRDPAPKIEAALGDYLESQLVDIKFQAEIEVANKDIRLEDPKIGARPAQRCWSHHLPHRGVVNHWTAFRTQIDLHQDRRRIPPDETV